MAPPKSAFALLVSYVALDILSDVLSRFDDKTVGVKVDSIHEALIRQGVVPSSTYEESCKRAFDEFKATGKSTVRLSDFTPQLPAKPGSGPG